MKKSSLPLLLLVSLLITGLSAIGQKDSSGIFNTADDYNVGRLSYAINYKTEKHKINDFIFLNTSQVKVKHEGKTYFFDKNKIYGYRNTKGHDFRFVNNKSYEILNSGELILLYKYEELIHSPKSVPSGPAYYFTKYATDTPVQLTKENLKAAFPDQHKFHDALDENFRTDKELSNYDGFHKIYKVNWLYKNNNL